MKDNIGFSVIIPMYNSEETIERTIASVLNQSMLNVIKEVLIVNDGSTDKSPEIVAKYELKYPNLIRIINKSNGGVSSARNVGLANASSEWIALLDSDDEWIEDKIKDQLTILKQHRDIDFLGGNFMNVDLKIFNRKVVTLYKASLTDLCIKSFPQTSTVVFRKKIFEEIGGYDEEQSYGEDMNYFFRICESYNYYYMPKKLVEYGSGKMGFGESGLSANLKEMSLGVKKNMRELYKRKSITPMFYFFISTLNVLKKYRRIIIAKKNL